MSDLSLVIAKERIEELEQQLDALNKHQVAYKSHMEQQLAAKDAKIAELEGKATAYQPFRMAQAACNISLLHHNQQTRELK